MNITIIIIGFSLSLLIIILMLIAILYFYFYYGYIPQPDIYRHGNRDLPMVSLTFDDGPSEKFTPQILDILKEHGIYATFFLIGDHVLKYPEIARRIVKEGHELGNHTQNHRNIPTLSKLDLIREIIGATSKITEITGVFPDYIRPPRGLYDTRFRKLTTLLGQKIVLWSISSRDWRNGVSEEAVVQNVISKVRNGDIILFHDSGSLLHHEGGDRSATVKALPKIIKKLQSKGLQIVPLKKLLEENKSYDWSLPKE